MSNAVFGMGLVLKRGVYPIAEITEVTGPSSTLKTIDVTSHASTGGYSEFIPGLKDGGDVGIKGNFIAGDTNGQLGLQSDFNSNTINTYTITLAPSTGAAWTFSGYVTKFETSNPMDKEVSFACTIKITGLPTLVVTASTALTGLAISSGTITPATAGNLSTIFDYSDIVAAATATVTATGTGTMSLYVDGVYIQALVTATPSGAITFASPSYHKISVITQDTGKKPVTYTINAARL